MSDQMVVVRTVVHSDDITYLDNTGETGESVYVHGEDRLGWRFSGFTTTAQLAKVLFP